MRLLLTTAVFLALAATCLGQGGFFTGLRNFFRPRRQPQFNRPQGQNQQQQQQQQSFNNQQSVKTFSQQNQNNNGFNQNSNNNFHEQPQQQNSFNTNQNNFRGNSVGTQSFKQQQPSPQQSFVQAGGSTSNNAQGGRVCRALPYEDPNIRESPRCPDAQPNHFWNGKKYILTFNLKNDACTKFTGYQADNYCKAQGGRAVSLDSNEVSDHFLDISAQFAQRYYWTGGRMNHPCKTLYWPSGKSEGWEAGKRYWSHTGGSRNKAPQPDNRNHDQDGREDEICLAVLNNFYNDSIKWHDVACHHKKPTICEID